MSSILDSLKQRQVRWAESQGLRSDSAGYLPNIEDNLFCQMTTQSRSAFERGSGSELVDTKNRPAKMRALHSSSALAVNVFDAWGEHDTKPLTSVLGLGDEITSIAFEEQYPTGLRGIPPNIDVALTLRTGHIIGIESKFSEWLTAKPATTKPFKPAYFPEGAGLWRSKGLPDSQQLAELIHKGTEEFVYLNVAQLMKHALGMANNLGDRFSLFYVYYDWPGIESDAHHLEIQRFSQFVGTELRFKAFSYQEVCRLLVQDGTSDEGYLDYLRDRYF
jgi:hypothetical protein